MNKKVFPKTTFNPSRALILARALIALMFLILGSTIIVLSWIFQIGVVTEIIPVGSAPLGQDPLAALGPLTFANFIAEFIGLPIVIVSLVILAYQSFQNCKTNNKIRLIVLLSILNGLLIGILIYWVFIWMDCFLFPLPIWIVIPCLGFPTGIIITGIIMTVMLHQKGAMKD